MLVLDDKVRMCLLTGDDDDEDAAALNNNNLSMVKLNRCLCEGDEDLPSPSHSSGAQTSLNSLYSH